MSDIAEFTSDTVDATAGPRGYRFVDAQGSVPSSSLSSRDQVARKPSSCNHSDCPEHPLLITR